MNPLTNVKNITKLNETELATGSIHKKSWHDMYKDSAWIFIGGLAYDLTEGDILAVFSQYGEIVNINLVRDKKTGKTKGFCFLCYANQKSTVLAVDNFNGMKLCSRTIRVDHVSNYKPPKEDERDDEITKTLKSAGCAPKPFQTEVEDAGSELQPKKKKSKKEKKEKKKKSSNRSGSENETTTIKEIAVKKEKEDAGYDKYDTSSSRGQEINKYSEKGKVESLHIREIHYSRFSATIKKRYSDNSSDEDSMRKKIEQKRDSSHFKESYTKDNKSTSYNDSKHVSSLKSYKRQRSSSSDDNSRNRKFSDRSEKLLSKSRHSDSKKHKSASSSSSDDESSSESSSDSEKDRNSKGKRARREQYEKESRREAAHERKVSKEKVFESNKSYSEKSRYHQSEDSDFSSSRKEQYVRSEKYTEHRSKPRSDDKYSNSHKSKYNKR